jgi:DNA replication and repair protein RecF
MITDLRLQNFRSYRDEAFEVAPGVNIIVGPNASGKTNLLEAVLVLARGSSFRAKDVDLVKFESPWARIDADLEAGDKRTVKIMAEGNKGFEIGGQKLTRLSQQKSLPLVIFEPNHLLLFNGSPELRRNFLDDLIEQTVLGFSATRRHYKRVLTQRNTLLKKNPRGLNQQLFVWNIRLSELGGQIARQRQDLIARMNQEFTEIYSRLSGRKHDLELFYSSQFTAEAYESSLLKSLEAEVDLDVVRGFTLSGPHRDDFEVEINGKNIKVAASRGEIRTTVLALKILELQTLEQLRNIRPLLLLDDVFSELDNKRRRQLTEALSGHQTFITTTDADMAVANFPAGNIIPVSPQGT